MFSLELCLRPLLDDLHHCFLLAILQNPFRDCDYKRESFEARERTDKGRARLLRPPPPPCLHSPVHLERAQVLPQKTEIEIVGCIMISNSIYIERGQQTLTSKVDCIQLIGKVEWPGVHDASIHWRYPTPQKLCSRLRASMEYGWYLTDEFPFHLRMVPDLLDDTRLWKSESPNLQSKFPRESREIRESRRGILHTSGNGLV